MKVNRSFESRTKFYGSSEFFPYGIARSGEFTSDQALLLENHGEAYQAIDAGIRQPVSVEEKAFLAVCRGESAAKTKHEQAWLRYRMKTLARQANLAPASLDKHGPESLVTGHLPYADMQEL